MKLLIDTHLLLWTAAGSRRLSATARNLLDDPDNQLFFSTVSVWEIVIKRGRGRDNFHVDPRLLRRNLLNNGYGELEITGQHALAVEDLPALHRDPFDRLLIAQSIVEGLTLLTADRTVARYPASIQRV
jgi:PIN domain nuclease of toxin-antitoxin system